ncbi:Uncharacterized protein TPAR_07981 [Tolypocladium paradoxum]|uniref:FAS1 domain-containing protein n=1 Tax=Tolypocladium paradoxum TaxID=94208 RepID=A0A2S4KNP3_9HYPO|nr:Uncharacterized protein TPAR_07981 [Tolypocladium paradoxum]
MHLSNSMRCLVASLALSGFANAQSAELLSGALKDYADLSLFRSLLSAFPKSLQSVVANKNTNITVLVPTNNAFTTYLSNSGISDVTKLGSEEIQTFFSYHILSASLKSSDFDDDRGMAIPTLLQEEKYNNRTAGPELMREFGNGATGQILFASSSNSSSRMRRQSTSPTVMLRAGLGQDALMRAVDGAWGPNKVNSFQIIDSVLIPPKPCSVTIRSSKDILSGLDAALNKTGLYPTLDTTPNVTCLAPSTSAFREAGNPQEALSKIDLTGALLHHTLKEVTYTNYLEDGMVLGTFNNTKVRVRIMDDDIYFNNAKVIEANVLTNNGLIHILDAVIKPDSNAPSSTSTASTSTASNGAPSSTSSSRASPSQSSAANVISVGFPGLVALVAGLAIA